MKDARKPDTNRNPHHDTGRERNQPYASEHEDYRQGPAKPPRERPAKPDGGGETPPRPQR